MELRQLEYFMAVCEELHFTKASEKLGITQPTLSHQIKALEDEIGVPLFDRMGKKIAITEAGRLLYEQASKAFGNLKGAIEKIQELQQIERGILYIGTLPGEINELISSLLLEFHKKYPRIQIRVISKDDIVERILMNELDLAVTIMPPEDERLTRVRLYKEDFYLAVSSNHPLASKVSANFDEIRNYPIILFPQNHQCRKLIESTCTSKGFQVDALIETNDIDSILNFVEAGAGITILSKTLLNLHNREKIKIIPLVNPGLCREIGMVFHKDKYLTSAVRSFIDMLNEHIEVLKLGQSRTCGE